MAHKFGTVISLGGFCQVAYQIEQRFGHRISSPFDWLIAPLESIEKILSNDGEDFGKSIKVDFDGSAAICNHYGVAYYHDFPRNEQRFITINKELIETSRSKMLHKYTKFKNLMESNVKTLFIRLGGHHDSAFPYPYVVDPRQLKTDDLNRLCLVLSNKFPDLDFEIAFVFMNEYTKFDCDHDKLDRRIKIFDIPHNTDDEWFGDTRSWSPIFDRFDIDILLEMEGAQQFVGDRLDREVLHS